MHAVSWEASAGPHPSHESHPLRSQEGTEGGDQEGDHGEGTGSDRALACGTWGLVGQEGT